MCLVVGFETCGSWLSPPVTVKHVVRAIFSCQRLFLHRLFEGRGGQFRSKFFIVMVASMLCLAKPCRYLGGTPMWSEVSYCFWVPIWGLENDMLGNFLSHIRVIFWQPHVGQELASLHGRQQNQQPQISHQSFCGHALR